MTNHSSHDIDKTRIRMYPLGCCIRAFVALLIVVGLVLLLPTILALPNGDEWQIMRKVASLGGAAGFSHNTASGTVNLNGTRVTDGDLAVLDLGRSDILRTLDLCNTNVGDPGIKYVAQVKSLRYLYLGNTQVTDAAIPDLASLPQLGLLDLGGTRVTNAAVPEIASMRTLLWLNIENTAITSSGEEELRAAFPNIHRLKWPTRNAEQAAGNGREEKE